MYNSTQTPLMGLNATQWCPTLKRGLHNRMEGFLAFPPPPPLGATNKSFTNPNFVNANNPSVLRRENLYAPVTTKSRVSDHQQQQQKSPAVEETKKKRKRKRRNRKRNKKSRGVATLAPDEKQASMPALTQSFKNISVAPTAVEIARNAFRTRVPSICESEDSFIVFEDRVDDDESAIESETEVVFEESTEVSENEGMSSDSGTPRKKVRFATGENLCEVHPMIQWSYAYQAARKGPWEEIARDRERFKRRIRETEKRLCSVLNPVHRAKIFATRFNQQ